MLAGRSTMRGFHHGTFALVLFDLQAAHISGKIRRAGSKKVRDLRGSAIPRLTGIEALPEALPDALPVSCGASPS